MSPAVALQPFGGADMYDKRWCERSSRLYGLMLLQMSICWVGVIRMKKFVDVGAKVDEN